MDVGTDAEAGASAADEVLPMRQHCRAPGACKAAKPTTHCRSCAGHSLRARPEIEAKRQAAQAAYYARPDVKAMLAVRIQAAQAAALRDPEKRAKLVEHGHRQYRDYLSRDDVRARNRDPEIRKRAGQAITQTRLADILPEHRAEYQRLVRQKGLSAAEARAVIADMPGSELRAARRAIADFNNRQHARADREREQLY